MNQQRRWVSAGKRSWKIVQVNSLTRNLNTLPGGCSGTLKRTCQSHMLFHRGIIAKNLPSSVKEKKMEIQSIRKDARDIFNAAVDSVYPPEMVKNAVILSNSGNTMSIQGKEYSLQNNVFIVGFGKAVSGMASALEEMIGQHIVKGIISVPFGSQALFKSIGKQELCVAEGSKIQVYEGAENNLPDENSCKAALAIEELVEKLGKDDLLIVLISGGGSALLPSPRSPVTLQDELVMTKVVAASGGSIQELNILRQNIETLKGGGLALKARPATVISLILSDVIDDKLDIISSGPTVPRLSSPRQCLQILERLQIMDKVPPVIMQKFEAMTSEKIVFKETLPHHSNSRSSDSKWVNVQNVIIGSNVLATQAAQKKAAEIGYVPFIMTNSQTGEARKVGAMFAELAKYIILTSVERPPDKGLTALSITEIGLAKYGVTKIQLKGVEAASGNAYNSRSGVCLICGGETTVNVQGKGRGGRCQEMALAFAINFNSIVAEDKTGLLQNSHVEFLSAGTDGQDGATDAAGAVVNHYLISAAVSAKMNPAKYLDDNDSYSLLKALQNRGSLIQCGLTGTNVMDIQLLIVKLLS